MHHHFLIILNHTTGFPHYFNRCCCMQRKELKKNLFDLGASPQAPGIYRVWTKEENLKTRRGLLSPHLFPGLLQALGSLPSVALSSCKNVSTECRVPPLVFLFLPQVVLPASPGKSHFRKRAFEGSYESGPG
jgi:hypothetical protein